MRLQLLLATLGLSVTITVAQKKEQEYVVTTAGDTLRGEVLLIGTQQQTIRLRRPNQPTTDFSPAQATSYGNETGALWVSRPIGPGGTLRFVAPLVRGPVSLYSGEDAGGNKRYFLQPQDSAYVVAIPPTTARLAYLRLLPGCPNFDFAYSKFERAYPYTYSGQTRLVRDYNTCRYPQQTTTLVATPRGTKTHFGIKAGIHTTRFNFPGLTQLKQRKMELSYQAGISMLVSGKSHFALQLEATYLAARGEYGPGNHYNGNAFYTTTRTLVINYAQLQVPLLLRYNIGTGNLRPYLNAGPVYAFNTNHGSEDVYQDSNKPTPTRLPLNIHGGNSIGGTAGIGVLIQQPGLPLFTVEARADYLTDSASGFEQAPNHISLRLDFGVLF
ncbi:porin family protein [uncultured Hymenobacter sp.]|uniref:porin family protein n=1 Tax=uncultured Hymenobacter sp. TaxID=170016 RepID=UPI0035CB1885